MRGVKIGYFENINQAVRAPYIAEIRGVSLRIIGRWGWGKDGGRAHIIIAPEKIDAIVIISTGYRKLASSLWVLWRGVREGGFHKREMARRVEYAAVRAVASINIIMIKMFDGLKRSISRIRSLE